MVESPEVVLVQISRFYVDLHTEHLGAIAVQIIPKHIFTELSIDPTVPQQHSPEPVDYGRRGYLLLSEEAQHRESFEL